MKEEVFKYFTENNKSGWKMKEKNLKNDYNLDKLKNILGINGVDKINDFTINNIR